MILSDIEMKADYIENIQGRIINLGLQQAASSHLMLFPHLYMETIVLGTSVNN